MGKFFNVSMVKNKANAYDQYLEFSFQCGWLRTSWDGKSEIWLSPSCTVVIKKDEIL